MATKNFRSTVLEPTSEFAYGDKLRFTALATVGEVLKGSFSETTIGEDGVYSVDLQYGKHRIDYKPYEGVWRHFADVEVNADTLATTLQDLALASVPVTDEAVLVLQGILADAEAAKTAAETAEAAAETALASIDSKIAEVAAGYPALLAAQLSKTVVVNAATGDDTTADGSSAKPFKTIKKAIESQPDLVSVVVSLVGGADKASAHVIDATINSRSRIIEIAFNSNHVVLSDSITTVFSVSMGGAIYISDRSSGEQYLHANTSKTFVLAQGECLLHLGGYIPCNFYLSNDASISLMRASYITSRGVSRLTSSRLNMRSSVDISQPATAEVISVSSEYAGSVLVNHWSASMGANYKDFVTASNVSTIVGSLKAVSN